LNVYIVDPSSDSLDIAKQRANEITHGHTLFFKNAINELPNTLDFVIIATNSKVRLAVIEELVRVSKVTYLILEKVLFPSIQEYDLALDMVNEHGIQCWVNHPRRMYEDYKKLKEHFVKDKTYLFQLVGSSWGLACNGLHFIDLFEYLTDSSLFSISCENLNPHPIDSKRGGYLEFEGTIQGQLVHNHLFSISSLSNDIIIAPSISIMTDDFRIFIQESGKPMIYLFQKENNFDPISLDITMKFQSQLTGVLFEQLIQSNTCDLPTLQHASITHKVFIQSLLNHWNKGTGIQNNLLTIT
jgi:predicted dehydrogenase